MGRLPPNAKWFNTSRCKYTEIKAENLLFYSDYFMLQTEAYLAVINCYIADN